MSFTLPEVKEGGDVRNFIENDRFIVAMLGHASVLVFNKLRNAWHPVRYLPCVPCDRYEQLHLLGFYDDNHFGLLLITQQKAEIQPEFVSEDEVISNTMCRLAIVKASDDYGSFSLVSKHPVCNLMIDADVFSCFRDPSSPCLIVLADKRSSSVEVYQIQPDVVVGSPVSTQYLGRFECTYFATDNWAEYNQKLYIVGCKMDVDKGWRTNEYMTNEVMIYDLQRQELRTLPIADPCPRLLIDIFLRHSYLALAERFLVFPQCEGVRPYILDMEELRWVNADDQDGNAGGEVDVASQFLLARHSLTARGNLLQSFLVDRQQVITIRPLSIPTLLELSLRVIHSTATKEFASCLSESDVSTVKELVKTLTGERHWKRHRKYEYEMERGTFAFPDYDYEKCNRMEQLISRGELMLGLCSCAMFQEHVPFGETAHVWVFNRARNAWTHCVPLTDATRVHADNSVKLLQFISDDLFVAIAAFDATNGQPGHGKLGEWTTPIQIQLVTYRLSTQLNRAERIASRVLAEMQFYRIFDCDAFYDSDKPWILAIPADRTQKLVDIYQVLENEVVRRHTVKYPYEVSAYGWKDSRVYMLGKDMAMEGKILLFSFDADGTYPVVEVQDPAASFRRLYMPSIYTRLWNGSLVNPWQNGCPNRFDVETNEWRKAGKGRDTVLENLLCAHISSEGELLRSYKMDRSEFVTSYWLSIPPLLILCSRFIHSKIRLDWARRLKESEVATFEELGFFLATVPIGQLYEV